MLCSILTRTLVVLAALTCLTCLPAAADVATPRPGWTSIQMQAEEVNIVVAPDKVKVSATFEMYNTGKDEAVKMGYPVGPFETSLNDFAVTVDGQAVQNIGTQSGQASGVIPAPVGATRDYRFSGPYKQWKVFDVPMKANQKRIVTVSYWVTPATITDKEKGDLNVYSYILRTGATWKGNIERALLRISLDGVRPEQLVRAAPNGWQKSSDGRAMTLLLTNIKPTDDVEIIWGK